MWELRGTPSDALPDVLSIGRSDISTMFVSMSARDSDGRDAEYLAWHTLDHRPEQYRVPGLRASLRVVSTPSCRLARLVSEERYDAVDHVMTYFFADREALVPFGRLGAALDRGGRMTHMLPAVDRAVYVVDGMSAAARIKAGADVLPWWPAVGVYLLLERGAAGTAELSHVEGVAGVWWANAVHPNEDVRITYCFLDDDPVVVAHRLRPALEKRWAGGTPAPLLAAPFHVTLAREWDRYLP